MKKLFVPLTLALLLCSSVAYADLIKFGDISGAVAEEDMPTTPISNANFKPGSSSFFANGQSITFWSSPELLLMHNDDGYPWRYALQSHFGLYANFDSGTNVYYEAGLKFAMPVFDLSFTYEGGNDYIVTFLFADGASDSAVLNNPGMNWGHPYDVDDNDGLVDMHGGIIGITFLYGGHLGSAPEFALLDMNFTTKSAPTPLPGTIWLMGMGVAGLFGYARRKRMQ
jgi:hypothetical protein